MSERADELIAGPEVPDIHDDCKKQLERLKLHLIELDKELEEESMRHEQERTQLMSRIQELEEAAAEALNNEVVRDEGNRMEFEENLELKSKLAEQTQKIDNLQTSFDLLQSSKPNICMYVPFL